MTEAFNWMVEFIYEKWANPIFEKGIVPWAQMGKLDDWNRALNKAGSVAPRCIGFIDGTMKDTCRPGGRGVVGDDGSVHVLRPGSDYPPDAVDLQELAFSGKDQAHGLKYLSVVAPIGLIVELFGPELGPANDAGMVLRSGMEARFRTVRRITGKWFYVYGDPAFRWSWWLQRGFKGAMSPHQRWWKKRMNKLRQAVEHGCCYLCMSQHACLSLAACVSPSGRLVQRRLVQVQLDRTAMEVAGLPQEPPAAPHFVW
jgi:hypothetical protein